MLRPNKHDHPDRTIVGVSVVILKKMEKDHVVSYDGLLSHVEKLVEGGGRLFVPALDFLFLFGVLEYYRKSDTFELVSVR